LNLHGLLALHGGVRTLADIAAIGVFGGFFVVPLNALVQQRSRPESLARVIGANSILNALFMVAAAVLGAVGLAKGLTVLQLILMAALLNAVVAIYIYTLVPEFLLRFVCWLLVRTLYRLTKRGARFPESGAALIVCNHVSFVDALVISAACRRPIRFIMDEAIFRAPIIRVLASGMKAIPIASAKDDVTILERHSIDAAAARRGAGLHLARRSPRARLAACRVARGAQPHRGGNSRPGDSDADHGVVGLDVLAAHPRDLAASAAQALASRGGQRGRSRRSREGRSRGASGARVGTLCCSILSAPLQHIICGNSHERPGSPGQG
jgi:hypothetical protein